MLLSFESGTIEFDSVCINVGSVGIIIVLLFDVDVSSRSCILLG